MNRDCTLIVLHYYATGPGQELYAWLRERGENAALLELPFPFSRRRETLLTYSVGGAERQVAFPSARGPLLLRCLGELGLTRKAFDYLAGEGLNVTTCIGNGFFDTLVALRRRIARVILFTIDYAPGARHPLLRPLYRFLDAWAAERASAVWNLSPRMQEERLKYRPGLRCRQVLRVPHGTHYEALKSLRHLPENPASLAFMGHLKADSGLDLVLDSLARLRRAYPALRLEVVGDGPARPGLEAQAAALGLGDCVKFHGFVEDHRELEKILCGCAVGLALYNPGKDVFSRNADPGKVKVYLGCGLPVLITDLPAVAAEIGERGAGAVVEYDAGSLAAGLGRVLENYPACRAAAEAMGAEYDWGRVFARAFEETR